MIFLYNETTSLQRQQDVLARLYTDETLRHAFRNDPIRIGKENGLNESEITQLTEISAEELDFFAESLFWKRLRAR